MAKLQDAQRRAPEFDDMMIYTDSGGSILDRAGEIAAIIRQADPIEIRGSCLSACTMLLVLPSDLLCARPGAWFGFHRAAGGSADAADAANVLMWRHYPVGLQALLGHLTANTVYLRGRDLIARGIVRECAR